jgi:hypothetical protein
MSYTGSPFHLKSNIACIWRSWPYISHNNQSTGTLSTRSLLSLNMVDFL